MPRLVIGYAEEYYTLWEVGDSSRRFIKNISKDLEVAKKQYPGVEVDVNLRGTVWAPHEYTPYEEPEFNGSILSGKFVGSTLDPDVCDVASDYLTWYQQCWSSNEQEKEAITKVLEARGYHYVEHYWHSPQEYAEYLEDCAEADQLKTILETGTAVVNIETNPSSEGWLSVGKDIYVKFPELKEFYYDGYEYYLPVLKGKAKRIKNKRVRIQVEPIERGYLVTDFEVLK